MRHRSIAIGLLLLLGPALAAQEPRADMRAPAGAAGARITGIVYDSVAGAPLRDATVQLVSVRARSADARTTTTDAAGGFVLDDIPAGSYEIGFLHPRLDSLTLPSVAREITIADSGAVRVELAIPSAARLRALLCASVGGESGTLLVGIVRDASSGGAVAGALVSAEWLEYAIRVREIGGRIRVVQDTTDSRGAFAFCDLPTGGTVVLSAARGGDGTDRVEVTVADAPVARRDLHLGAVHLRAGAAGVRDSAAGGDTVLARQYRAGEGRLRGTVRAQDGGTPVAGAQVRIAGGADATTDARGEFVLREVPQGTRMLEVRALGFHPTRQAVEIMEGTAPIQVTLATFQAVLDTVRVTASRMRLANTGFEERRRQGAGRFLTSEQIMRRATFNTSDLFTMVAGMRVERTMLGDTRVTVRGPFGRCRPLFVIDGSPMRQLTADDVNAFTHPDDIAGIEVYAGAYVPPEFQDGMSGCGAVVIWTKASTHPARRWSLARRALHALGAIAAGVLTGVLLGRM